MLNLTRLRVDYTKPFNIILGITFCLAILATFASLGFLGEEGNFYQKAYFLGTFFANTALYTFLVYMLLVYPFLKFTKYKRFSLFFGGGIAIFIMILLYADLKVFELYNFHINLAMLDLFLNANGEVIAFSSDDWLLITRMALRMLILGVVAVYFGSVILSKVRLLKVLTITLTLVIFLASNLIYAVDFYRGSNYITQEAYKVIFYKPLTMSSFLRKLGVKQLAVNDRVKLSNKKTFYYPQKPLNCPLSLKETPANIIVVMIDSLRFDVVNEKVTPNLAQLAKENIYYTNHYSGGNATRSGVFSFFYGIPSFYWNHTITSGIRPALFEVLSKYNYDIKAFASANLTKPEFYQNIFVNIKDLRLSSKGNNASERDNDALNDFYKYLDLHDKKRPFFSFIFFDQLHSQMITEEDAKLSLPFTNKLHRAEYLKLNKDYDGKDFFNLYRNISYVIDKKIGSLVQKLKDNGLWDNSIIIFTADHGEEFNDNKLGFWGHNSNFTDYQIKVPLIINWSQRSAVSNELSTHYDIAPTIIKDYFNCTNDPQDYSFGRSLFSMKEPVYFLSGSYLENAIITKNQIALIRGYGDILYKDRHYRDLAQDKIDRAIVMEVLKNLGRLLDKPNNNKDAKK